MSKPQLTTLHLAHLPPDLNIHLVLYDELKNSRFLRKQLLDGNAEFEYAFLDARTILSSAHVLAAVFRAVNDMLNDRMRSKNVHSEIVLAMSSNNNISESFRKFGISDSTSKLLVIKVAKEPAEAIEKQLEWAVEAEPVEFTDANLVEMSDTAEIRKAYKLNADVKPKTAIDDGADRHSGPAQGEGDERRELEIAILGLMAVRGAT